MTLISSLFSVHSSVVVNGALRRNVLCAAAGEAPRKRGFQFIKSSEPVSVTPVIPVQAPISYNPGILQPNWSISRLDPEILEKSGFIGLDNLPSPRINIADNLSPALVADVRRIAQAASDRVARSYSDPGSAASREARQNLINFATRAAKSVQGDAIVGFTFDAHNASGLPNKVTPEARKQAESLITKCYDKALENNEVRNIIAFEGLADFDFNTDSIVKAIQTHDFTTDIMSGTPSSLSLSVRYYEIIQSEIVSILNASSLVLQFINLSLRQTDVGAITLVPLTNLRPEDYTQTLRDVTRLKFLMREPDRIARERLSLSGAFRGLTSVEARSVESTLLTRVNDEMEAIRAENPFIRIIEAGPDVAGPGTQVAIRSEVEAWRVEREAGGSKRPTVKSAIRQSSGMARLREQLVSRFYSYSDEISRLNPSRSPSENRLSASRGFDVVKEAALL